MFFEKRHPSTHHERPGFGWNPGFRSPVSSCVLTWLDGRWGRLALRVHSPAASCSGPVRPARCQVFCLLLLATLPRGPEHRRGRGPGAAGPREWKGPAAAAGKFAAWRALQGSRGPRRHAQDGAAWVGEKLGRPQVLTLAVIKQAP